MTAFRYRFADYVKSCEMEASLLLARWAVEALHGESLVRLEAAYSIDPPTRTCVIDADSEAGRSLNRIFVGFLEREFGADAFDVERVDRIAHEPVAELAGGPVASG